MHVTISIIDGFLYFINENEIGNINYSNENSKMYIQRHLFSQGFTTGDIVQPYFSALCMLSMN